MIELYIGLQDNRICILYGVSVYVFVFKWVCLYKIFFYLDDWTN